MSFEKQMYEVDEKWEASYFSEKDRNRIQYIKGMIPEDARTLIDVGCGNGIMVNYLKDNFDNSFDRLCGTDRSQSSLKHVRVEKYESDITSLPFGDNEFDVSLCLEVIEHLPIEVYRKALEELKRISRKYIIISVPYNEDLDFSKTKCIVCKTEFSPFYHVRNFTESRIEKLFDGSDFKCTGTHFIEQNSIPLAKGLKKFISRKINPAQFPAHAICPMCGYNEFDRLKKKKSSQKKSTSSEKGLSKWWPHKKQAKWIAALYARRSN